MAQLWKASEHVINEAIDKRLAKGAGLGAWCRTEWLPIVIQLEAELAKLDPHFVIDQIKEKFGELRFYAQVVSSDVDRDHFYNLIHEAEAQTQK